MLLGVAHRPLSELVSRGRIVAGDKPGVAARGVVGQDLRHGADKLVAVSVVLSELPFGLRRVSTRFGDWVDVRLRQIRGR